MNGLTSIGSPDMTAMTSTTDLKVGMIVDHASFATGTKILLILGPTSIRLDSNALTAVNVARDFYFEFIFQYPPIKNDGEDIVMKDRVSTSISGARQVSTDFTEFKLDLEFTFLTLAEVTSLKFFWNDWAGLGYEFKYFPDKTSVTYIAYEKDTNSFKPAKVTPVLYKVAFKFRRLE